MYTVIDKEYIRKKHFVEGWSIRRISKELKLARQTVRKMLGDGNIPKYNLSQERPSPIMDPFKEIIVNILKEDETAPRKQRHNAVRIYERLRDEYGFMGGASTARRYVSKLKKAPAECFLMLEANPGEQIQVDFGHAQVDMDGKRIGIHIFCMRLKFSNVPFVIAYPTERLEAFLEGHVQGFAYFGGVPKEGLYDNATTQVVKVLEGPDREEHQWFSSLRSHYLFDSHFCRPAKGNEKGSVESLVKYVRNHALVPVPAFNNWEELNAHLLQWCDQEREKHHEKWIIEQLNLRPLPETRFSSARPTSVVASPYSLVTIDRNRYSVPCRFTGQALVAKAFVDRIEVSTGLEIVAVHPRSYRRNEVIMELEHYLPILERKPHAVTHATVVRRLPKPFTELREYMTSRHNQGYKDFLAVLLLLREHTLMEISGTIEALGKEHATAASIHQKLSPIVQIVQTEDVATTVNDTECYDKILVGVG